ncbi:hypothetical protein C4M98_01290, partial [Mycoplasmopsis pullorum]
MSKKKILLTIARAGIISLAVAVPSVGASGCGEKQKARDTQAEKIEKLNSLGVEFDYKNKEKIFPNDFEIQKLTIKIAPNDLNAQVIDLSVKKFNDSSVVLSYKLSSDNLTSELKEFEISNFLSHQYIEEMQKEFANLQFEFDYPNKAETTLDQVQIDSITYTNSPAQNDFLTKYKVQKEFNFVLSDLKIVQKDYANDALVISYSMWINKPELQQLLQKQKLNATIRGFKNKRDISEDDLKQEKNRLNLLNLTSEITNTKILASDINLENWHSYFSLNLDDQDATFEVSEISGYNDYKGLLEIKYKLISTRKNFNKVESDLKSLIIGEQTKHYLSEQERIDNLSEHFKKDTALISLNTNIYKHQTQASSISTSDFVIDEEVLKNNQIEIIDFIIDQTNNSTGELVVTYRIKSARANLDTITNQNIFVMSENKNSIEFENFLTDQEIENQNHYTVQIRANSDQLNNLPSAITNASDFNWSISSANNNWEIIQDSKQILSANDKNGTLTLSYSVQNNSTNEIRNDLTYTLEGFLSEQIRLNRIWNSLEDNEIATIKDESLNKLPSQIIESDLNIMDLANSNAAIKLKEIITYDNLNGTITLKFELVSTKENLSDVSSSVQKTVQILNLDSLQKRELIRLENIKNNLVANYIDKANILPIENSLQINQIVLKIKRENEYFDLNQEKVQIEHESIHIYLYDDLNGKIKISYILKSLQYPNVLINVDESLSEDNDYDTITGFKTELDRINELTNLTITYPNQSQLLPSEVLVSLHNLQVNSELRINLNDIQEQSFDNHTGELVINYKIQSQKYLELITQNYQSATLIFDSWNKRAQIEKNRLNEIASNSSIRKAFAFVKDNESKENTKASQVQIQDIVATIYPQSDA